MRAFFGSGAVMAWVILVVGGQGRAAEERSAVEIAQRARQVGDATAGALVFYANHLGCARCHLPSEAGGTALGPDLTRYPQGERPSDVELVEAITHPSKRIRQGFESHLLLTSDGRTVAGRILERSEQAIRLLDAAGQVQEFAAADIEGLRSSGGSSMPTGLAEQMGGPAQLDDLVRFLIELRDGGPERATQLRPSSAAVHLPVAEYESQIDHAGLIKTATAEVLKEGEAIYARVCANCHGTLSEAGSLPHSLRFAEGKFKNGSDPYSLYRTLTYGFGMMTPQPWMVPRQKYAVIHYLREHYLRERNRSQWSEVTEAYLAALPQGSSLGPEPSRIDPWNSMDYGPALTHTYQISSEPLNIAYKGIAIRLDAGVGGVARGDHWTIFDTDTLRWAAGWQSGDAKDRFIDWRGIQFNGQHNIHPRIAGEVVFANGNGPGWANPANRSFADESRVVGRDARRYGPLPRDWGKFIGQYRWGNSVVVAYRVGETTVHEVPGQLPAVPASHGSIFSRTVWMGPRAQDLLLQVADLAMSTTPLRVGYRSTQDFLEWENDGPALILRVKAGGPVQFQLGIAADQRPAVQASPRASLDLPLAEGALPDGSWPWLRGGPAAWTIPIQTSTSTSGRATDPFLVETLSVPASNPWSAQLRCTGLDFFSDGSLAVCTWDGDVWRVSEPSVADGGESEASAVLVWRRMASGLFQPLGLKIVEDQIYVTCRDQLARLHDLNGDGEIDFYECFNNDHQVTEHFHEFAMGLQRDAEGNFYYAKSARHALKAVVPHHGTLLKVTPDGAGTEILANGFRAANGVCLNPDGSFFVTDQEGHWNPKNRINRVVPNPGGSPRFYGNLFGYTAVTESADSLMEQPLCWITNEFDRSPGELVWVSSDRWGSLQGELLELSYGMGRAFLVLQQRVGELSQGGMVALPIPDFPTGVMRGRFHPADGQLYLCGLFAWAGNAQQPGGLYRIRRTEAPLYLPSRLRAHRSGIELQFLEPLRAASVTTGNFAVKVWGLKRTANYGSKHIDEKPLTVVGVVLDADQRTVRLEIPDLQPTWGMEIRYQLEAVDGQAVNGKIHNTIHVLAEP